MSDTLESFSELAARQGVTLEGSVGPGVDPVYIDVQRIGRALNRHAGARIFDIALINDKALTPALKAKYALEGATQIVADIESLEVMDVQPILGEYLEEDDVARHASLRVAEDLLQLALHARDTGSKAVGA